MIWLPRIRLGRLVLLVVDDVLGVVLPLLLTADEGLRGREAGAAGAGDTVRAVLGEAVHLLGQLAVLLFQYFIILLELHDFLLKYLIAQGLSMLKVMTSVVVAVLHSICRSEESECQ